MIIRRPITEYEPDWTGPITYNICHFGDPDAITVDGRPCHWLFPIDFAEMSNEDFDRVDRIVIDNDYSLERPGLFVLKE